MLYAFGDYILDPVHYELHQAGRRVPVEPRVFDVLAYLVQHSGQTVPTEELLEQLYPHQFAPVDRLTNAVAQARKVLGDSTQTPKYIQTMRRRGYCFIAPVEVRQQTARDVRSDPAPHVPIQTKEYGQDQADMRTPSAPILLASLSTVPPEAEIASGLQAVGDDRPTAEWRQLTVLACQLVCVAGPAVPLDPEQRLEIMRDYHEICTVVMRRFDGPMPQNQGMEMVGYFGYPQAHEDDARRAVLTGLTLVEAIVTLTERLKRDWGLHVAVRVGIHTGREVLGDIGPHHRRELLALGDIRTMATHVRDLATLDTVLISQTTLRLVEEYVVCEALGTYTLEAAEPLAVYRVLPESTNQSHLERPIHRLTPFVGRDHEVGLLLDRWAETKERRGQVVLLSGEAGIGKSRLVQKFTQHLAGEAHVCITWHGSPYHQQSALYPLVAHLQRLLQFRRDDLPQARLRTLEEALASYGFALQEVVPLFATLLSLPLPERYPPLPLTPQRQKQKTIEAFLGWLLREAERQPVCVVMEDLHWIDPSTLEFLSLLIEQVAMARLFVLLVFRPDFRPPWALRSYLTSLALGRLSHRHVESMAEQITGGKLLPTEVLQQVVATTDGVPLFVEEWIKMILESGLVKEWEGQYTLAGPLPTGAIPVTLHDLLMARLDRLASAKAVAQLGAVLGRTFSYEMLRAVTPLDEAALQQALTQLVDAELLYQRGVSPQATYLFKHALLQEAAYQSLLKRTRQQCHQRIAQVLTTHFPEAAATQPELLARHYTEAGLIEQAIPYWQQAGQQASERSAYREAISHLTTGIELLKTLPETPTHTQHALTLHIALGTALQMTTGLATSEVEHAYAQARALCRQVGETPQHVQVLLGVWRYYIARPQFQAARELGDTLLRLAHQAHDPALAVVAHYALGVTQLNCGALPVARRHLEEGLIQVAADQGRTAVFRMGQDLGVGCYAYAAVTLWLLGYPEQALARLHEALALAHALAHPYSLGLAWCYAAILAQRCGDVLAVHAQAEAMVALSLEQGFPQWVALGMSLRGWALAMQGHDQEGLVQVRQGIAAYRATGAALGSPYLYLLLAEVAAHLGHLADGLQALAEAHRLVEQHEERSTEAEVYRLRGVLLLRQPGTPQAEAEAWLRRALDVARRQEAKMLELRVAMSLSRLWEQQGKQAEARVLLASVYGWFTEGFATADLQEAQTLLEDLAG